MKEHDELSVHGDADVVGEFGHNTALHLGFAVGVWRRKEKQLADRVCLSCRKYGQKAEERLWGKTEVTATLNFDL